VKIISSIRALDDHDEKVAPIVQIAIAHRRFEKIAVLLDPAEEIDRCLNGGLRRRVVLLQGFCRSADNGKVRSSGSNGQPEAGKDFNVWVGK
jgi:hypothetical protein